MKINKNYFIALLVFAIVMLLIGLFGGCTPMKNPEGVTIERKGEHIDYSPDCEAMEVTHMEYSGHKYIIFHAHYRLAVVHDPDCEKCKQNNNNNNLFNW